MQQQNPYAAPKATVSDTVGADGESLKQIATGQKLVIYAVLLNFATLAADVALPGLGILLGLAAFILSVIGIFRLGATVTNSVVIKVILVLCMILPLVNLIVLLSLNSRATSKLREGGYRVGLMGASKR